MTDTNLGALPIQGHSFRAEWASTLVLANVVDFWLSRPDNDPAWKGVTGPRPAHKEIKRGKLPEIPYTGKEDKGNEEGDDTYKICIIGAGVAGLFAAMVIDYINEEANLNFKYEILEASDETRFGGRLYTHHFSDSLHDYYDVGAMRFPDITIMKRTFDLFRMLGFEKGALEPADTLTKLSPSSPRKLIPYILNGQNCPQYYNDLQYPSPPVNKDDPFRVQSHRRGERIPQEWLKQGSKGPSAALNEAIAPFKRALKEDVEAGISDGPGWEKLMAVDHLSVRQYLLNMGYNFRTIEWMETFGSGTLNYDEAFSEVVISSLDFDYYSGDPNKPVQWWCVEGGTQRVADAMKEKLKQGGPKFRHRVTMIKREPTIPGHNDMVVRVGPAKGNEADEDRRRYAAVFNSTTLASMQRMDLTDAVLNYGTKLAIRAIRYGVSCKVGIKFKTAWWIKKYGISDGGVAQTDLPLRVCVYPSYNLKDEGNAVLLCSYTWGQDAQRLAALISKKNDDPMPHPDIDQELKELLCRDLALLHCPQNPDGTKNEAAVKVVYEEISSQWITHHAYDWGADKDMSGAFAHFGPGQFSKMYSDLVTPSAGGKLFIIGEAASKHHAWIVGALESAVRGVYQMLIRYHGAKQLEVEKAIALLRGDKEGSPFNPVPYEEEDDELVKHQLYIADQRERAKRGVARLDTN